MGEAYPDGQSHLPVRSQEDCCTATAQQSNYTILWDASQSPITRRFDWAYIQYVYVVRAVCSVPAHSFMWKETPTTANPSVPSPPPSAFFRFAPRGKRYRFFINNNKQNVPPKTRFPCPGYSSTFPPKVHVTPWLLFSKRLLRSWQHYEWKEPARGHKLHSFGTTCTTKKVFTASIIHYRFACIYLLIYLPMLGFCSFFLGGVVCAGPWNAEQHVKQRAKTIKKRGDTVITAVHTTSTRQSHLRTCVHQTITWIIFILYEVLRI